MKLRTIVFGLSLIFTAVVMLDVKQAYAATFTVTNIGDSGAGSLRQAITDATAAAAGDHVVAFNIPGAGPHTITPASALPVIGNTSVTTPHLLLSMAAANQAANVALFRSTLGYA